MPKQGGQGKGKPKLKDRNFGKALIRRQIQGAQGMGRFGGGKEMMSVLDSSALDDYILCAEMEGVAPEVRRVHQNDAFLVEPTGNQAIQQLSADQFDYRHLRIPRKPSWNRTMTAEQVDRREKDSFLEWRREIALMEAVNPSLKVTPFEKNLEVWRQLWRVLERSDMAVQVVDARNPLMYYTEDLARYAAEHSPPRPMLLIVNKADLLTEYQRRAWARYFDACGIRFAFYSAFYEQEKIDRAAVRQNAIARGEQPVEDDDADVPAHLRQDLDFVDEEEVLLLVQDIAEQWGRFNPSTMGTGMGMGTGGESAGGDPTTYDHSEAAAATAAAAVPTTGIDTLVREDKERRRARVLTRKELILLLTELPRKLNLQPQEKHNGRICVGMLGYPNVGKSSGINTILGVSKSSHGVVRVAVSSTPGKTKHFQTIVVNEQLILCDCPGLVFPSFMRSTGEMICAGILPVNQMRDYIEPAAVISSRVPEHLLNAAYGMKIVRELDFADNRDRPPTPHEMLCALCVVKGYITSGTGRWDEFRAGKEMLRDFNDGKILFVSPPPQLSVSGTLTISDSSGNTASDVDMVRWLSETEKVMIRREKVAERIAVQRLREIEEENDREKRLAAMPHPEKPACELVFGDIRKGEEFQFYDDEDDDVEEEDEEDDDGGDDSGDDDQFDETAADHLTAHLHHVMISPGGYAVPKGKGSSSVSVTDSTVTMTAHGVPKRDHKRLKHWGKKNKKLRDKNPYSEDNGVISYEAYSTNRQLKRDKLSTEKVHRQDPRHAYGEQYTRAVHPHQESLQEKLKGPQIITSASVADTDADVGVGADAEEVADSNDD